MLEFKEEESERRIRDIMEIESRIQEVKEELHIITIAIIQANEFDVNWIMELEKEEKEYQEELKSLREELSQIPTTADTAKEIYNSLTAQEKQYAFKNNGFNSLHDLMDANALLPTFSIYDDPQLDYLNDIIKELDKLLLCY